MVKLFTKRGVICGLVVEHWSVSQKLVGSAMPPLGTEIFSLPGPLNPTKKFSRRFFFTSFGGDTGRPEGSPNISY